MIVVSNTSPLIHLFSINQIDLLKKLYEQIIIPEAVYNEIVVDGKYGSREIKSILWIQKQVVKNRTTISLLDLDAGEAEALTLSIELKSDLLLIDEKKARKVALKNNITFTGVLSVLIQAKKRKYISEIKPFIEQLRNKNAFWIRPELLNIVLERTGEL